MKLDGRFAILLYFLIFFSCGCRITKYDSKKTKMFDGDLEKLTAAFETVKVGESRESLIERGFQFAGDSNIQVVSGPLAARLRLGDNVFQGRIGSGEAFSEVVSDLHSYELVVIPHRDITEKIDRIYFTRQDLYRWGHDVKFILMFKGGPEGKLVVDLAKESEFIDEYRYDKAWAQGILAFFGLVRGATNIPKPPKVPDYIKNQ